MGGSPPIPKPVVPPPPPAPLPPPAAPTDTQAQGAITADNTRQRRRFSIRQTFMSGAPIGVAGDRPLGS